MRVATHTPASTICISTVYNLLRRQAAVQDLRQAQPAKNWAPKTASWVVIGDSQKCPKTYRLHSIFGMLPN